MDKAKNAVQDVRWFAVEKPGVPLLEADPLFEVDECGRLKPRECVLASPKEGLAPGAFVFRNAWPRRLSFSDSVGELVKVVDGVEVAREPIVIEDGTALYGPLPTDVSACWDEIRRVEAERNALALSLSHWPVKPLEQRLALRAERIRALLLVAAKLGDLTARVRLGREAYEAHDGLEAARWLADLVDCDPTARAALAVMKLEGWLPLGVTNVPEVRPLNPWPLASPSRRAYFLCKSALEKEQRALKETSAKDAISLSLWAIKLLQHAAELGYPFAQYELAHRYEEGEGVSYDLSAYRHWIVKAASGGHPDALYYIPEWMAEREPVKELWYDLGIVNGVCTKDKFHELAGKRFCFPVLYIRSGKESHYAPEKGAANFLELAQRGSRWAIDGLAGEAYGKKQWQDTVRWSTHLLPSDKDYIRYRHAVACAQLGRDEESVRVFRDIIQHPEEFDFSDPAVAETDIATYNYPGRAQGYLCWLTEKGRAHEDIREEDLSPEGFLVYGRLIEDENPAKAAECYQRARFQEACAWLGRLFVFGRGVHQDLEKAARLLSGDHRDSEFYPDTECRLLTLLLFLSGYTIDQEDNLLQGRMEQEVDDICEEYAGPMSPIRAFCEACLHWLQAHKREEETEDKALEALRAAAHTTLEEILARGSVR